MPRLPLPDPSFPEDNSHSDWALAEYLLHRSPSYPSTLLRAIQFVLRTLPNCSCCSGEFAGQQNASGSSNDNPCLYKHGHFYLRLPHGTPMLHAEQSGISPLPLREILPLCTFQHTQSAGQPTERFHVLCQVSLRQVLTPFTLYPFRFVYVSLCFACPFLFLSLSLYLSRRQLHRLPAESNSTVSFCQFDARQEFTAANVLSCFLPPRVSRRPEGTASGVLVYLSFT